MTYRDDREALHDEVDKLREERDAALRRAEAAEGTGEQAGRLRRLEAEIAAYQKHLAGLREQVLSLGGGRAPRSRVPVISAIAAVVGGALLIVVAAFWLLARNSASPPVRVAVAASEGADSPRGPTTSYDAPPSPAETTPSNPKPVATFAPPDDAPVPVDPIFPLELRWNATVRLARGRALPKGKKCQIEAHFKPGNAPVRGVTSLSIACGESILFDATHAPEGITLLGGDGNKTNDGKFVLDWRCLAPDGQIYVDTAKREAIVVEHGRHESRVELALDAEPIVP